MIRADKELYINKPNTDLNGIPFHVELSYLSQFEDKYYRINKRTGNKHMRCFPSCCSEGHNHKGHCGTTIEAVAKIKRFAKL